MTISLRNSFVYVDDPAAALAFYRDVLGFEVRMDVDRGGGMRWLTMAPVGGDVTVVLTPVTAGVSAEDGATLADLLAKGVLAGLVLASDDLDADFERIAASGADVIQEPMDQPWGARDAAFRDPAGNQLRISQA
ncbi:MAG: VOC family protein [Protaetiibacter sp.]